jgi:conjugal transfer ATP-binding protein TraC
MFFEQTPRTFKEFMEERVSQSRLHHLLPYESYDPQTQLFYNQDSTGFV